MPPKTSASRNPAFGAGPPQLVVLSGPNVGHTFRVRGQVVIGRASHVEVPINDSSVSRRHAQIVPTMDGAYILEDLGSKNGLRINGQPVKHARLEFGDEIQVGSNVVLAFQGPEFSEEQVAHRRRLEAVGRVGIGAAHDLNNMLGAIAANVDFLSQIPCHNAEQGADVEECLKDIRVALAHAGELTQGLLMFVRGKSRAHEVIDVSNLCHDVLRLLRHTLDGTLRVEQEIVPRMLVSGDRAELHLVLMNLCLNARDAMPNGGTLRLVAKVASSPLPVGESFDEAPRVEITVEDTGVGMDEATRERIFEPFFTTKPKGVGYGVGLASVLEVIGRHGGHVDVHSVPDVGTRFRLYLPLVRQQTSVEPQYDRPLVQPTGETAALILLVDDEDVVRRSVSRLLRRAGYKLLEAGNGHEAAEVFNKSSPRPDLVILDLDMPGLNGIQTQRRLRQIDPLVRTLFLSGYDYDAHPDAKVVSGQQAYLRKPCAAEVLLSTVHKLLGAPPDNPEDNERTVTD